MVEITARLQQGAFTLDIACALESQWTVIFGPSGAGKSTLLRILAGLITPQAGRISMELEPLLDTSAGLSTPAGRRGIGFVTQQAALFPHLSAAENVAFGLHGENSDARRHRVTEMLRFFGAESLAARKPAQLSGGERQRVALARALAPNPKLLLLDEPLAALDDASAQDILARLLQLPTRTVYVSHDVTEIWPLPASVIVLKNGRVTATGPLQQVLAPQRDRLLQLLRG
ncbi:MAG TPA: ATP-binding cassette domain-containing protein [Acidobacteriaceae bacterium]|nr:ATP-binding cassette domain-containing protein [Acidobacteriaceae bacterium]